jgi:hypothetical protein
VGRAVREPPLPENGGWAGRFVNRPYNFVADPSAAKKLQNELGCDMFYKAQTRFNIKLQKGKQHGRL